MQKIILIILILIFSGCNGYQPVFNSSGLNFYLKEIKTKDDSLILRKLVRILQPFKINVKKKPLIIELGASKKENVISRDNKGDPLIFELIIEVNVKVLGDIENENFIIKEKLTYNNRKNKFELEQYKKSLIKNMTDNIAEKLIINLKEIN